MQFEWDPSKARRNLAKHGVSFAVASEIWNDPLHVIVPDRYVDGEQRWHAIGIVGALVILLAVHAFPDGEDENRVRIIGARKATAHERRRYEQERL